MTGLRIAQVCADRGIAPGGTKGASQHLRGIAAGLIALGHNVTMYSARQPEGAFPASVAPLDAFVVEERIDVVYERYSLGHRGGLDRARQLGVPFALEVNAPLSIEAAVHRPETLEAADHLVEDELLIAADLVITVSSELTRWVEQRRCGPTITLPNGFEPEWFPAPATSLDPRQYELAFIGHPKPWHGADRLLPLLEAASTADDLPRLLVIGGGSGADRLIRDAQRCGLADQITATGALPPAEASRRLATAAIGLAPYRRLTPFYFCPLKVVDYMAAGLAVVATDQGDIAELVGGGGLIVDPDDDAALVSAVRGLLADDGLRRSLARTGSDALTPA